MEDNEGMGGSEVSMAEQETDLELTFEKRFGWYVVINRVAQNNVNEHDQILQKTIIEVLNQLLYLIEYDKEQARMQKKAMKQ